MPRGQTELRKSPLLAGTPACSRCFGGSAGRPTVTGEGPRTAPNPTQSCRPHALCGDPFVSIRPPWLRGGNRVLEDSGVWDVPFALHTVFREVGWGPRASRDRHSSERGSCLAPSHSPFWSQRVPCPARTPSRHLSSPQGVLSSGGRSPPPGGLNADRVTCDLGRPRPPPANPGGRRVSRRPWAGTWRSPLSSERPAQRGLAAHAVASPQEIKEGLSPAWKASGGGGPCGRPGSTCPPTVGPFARPHPPGGRHRPGSLAPRRSLVPASGGCASGMRGRWRGRGSTVQFHSRPGQHWPCPSGPRPASQDPRPRLGPDGQKGTSGSCSSCRGNQAPWPAGEALASWSPCPREAGSGGQGPEPEGAHRCRPTAWPEKGSLYSPEGCAGQGGVPPPQSLPEPPFPPAREVGAVTCEVHGCI